MHEKIVIALGDNRKIKSGFLESFNIYYCGMPSHDVFSVALRVSSGNQGYAMNLFYPKNARNIRVQGIEFTVFDVTPEMITLERLEKVERKRGR